MQTALRYVVTMLTGAALGIGLAVHTVRAAAFASDVKVGPWATGNDFGTADASARTRAVVALRGLLALPAKEARYYTAATDDAGRALDGRCRYRIDGRVLPGRWWSLTLYDRDGFLVPNAANRFSVQSGSVPHVIPGTAADDTSDRARILRATFAGEGRWTATASPNAPQSSDDRGWLPTGGIDRFELTLRLYLPADYGRGDRALAALPKITREGC